MSSGVRTALYAAVVLMVIGGVAYWSWLLEFFLPTGLSPVHARIGEATAEGQPYRDLFRTAYVVAGIAFMLMVPPLLRLVPAQTWPRVVVLLLGIFGLNVLLSALFTLDCAPSASQRCRDLIAEGEVSVAHQIHFATAWVTTAIQLAAAACVERWWLGGWRTAARVAFVIVLAAAIVVAILESFGSGQFVGLLVRLQLVTMVGLLFVGAAYLLNASRLRPW